MADQSIRRITLHARKGRAPAPDQQNLETIRKVFDRDRQPPERKPRTEAYEDLLKGFVEAITRKKPS